MTKPLTVRTHYSTHTQTVITTSPTPCQNLFGLLSLHSSVFIRKDSAYWHKPTVKHSEQEDCVAASVSVTASRTLGWKQSQVEIRSLSRILLPGFFLSSPLSWTGQLLTFTAPHSSSSSVLSSGSSPKQTLRSKPVQSSRAVIQTSPHPQPYVVLRLGPPGLLTDFCRALVRWKA